MIRPSVARLDLCRRLLELSGWNTTIWSWYCDEARDDEPGLNLSEPSKVVGGVGYFDHQYPAYDLGYLLRALPEFFVSVRKDTGIHTRTHEHTTEYTATYKHTGLEGNRFKNQDFTGVAETPEDAATTLAIALFEAGVLQAA